MIAFLSTLVALLPLVLGTAPINGDVDLGVNVSSEMSYVVADEASYADAVESAAAADTVIICINDDCRSKLVQYDDYWTLTITCGNVEHYYQRAGQYGGTLCGESP